MRLEGLAARVDRLIEESRFSGVVRVDRAGDTLVERAAGWAHRAYQVPMTVDTRLAIASGSKGFTALVALSLAADGTLPLTTRARELLGADLPLVDDRVTVEQLLGHRSGIGDYWDESAGHQIDDYVMTVPVHQLVDSDDYLKVLDGYPQRFTPGERIEYNNSGFVLLAILAERAAGTAFVDLVQQRVCTPANMVDTAFLRSNALPERTALGYLDVEGHRSNVLHLPVRGTAMAARIQPSPTPIGCGRPYATPRFSIKRHSPRPGDRSATSPPTAPATASVSFCTPPAQASCSRGTTPASPSAPCMIPTPTQPTRSLPTGQREPGLSPEHSTRCSSGGDDTGSAGLGGAGDENRTRTVSLGS